MTAAFALIAGLLFGAGLLLSGMTNPANVIAFLDVTGDWHPALAFTLGGAVAVAMPAYAWVRRRGHTVRGLSVTLPNRTSLTPQLLAGSAIFGIGWGLSGICPGPGLILLTGGDSRAVVFIGGVVAGLLLSGLTRRNTAGDAPSGQ